MDFTNIALEAHLTAEGLLVMASKCDEMLKKPSGYELTVTVTSLTGRLHTQRKSLRLTACDSQASALFAALEIPGFCGDDFKVMCRWWENYTCFQVDLRLPW